MEHTSFHDMYQEQIVASIFNEESNDIIHITTSCISLRLFVVLKSKYRNFLKVIFWKS